MQRVGSLIAKMPVPALKSTLLPHQEVSVKWCLEREAKGCILADDMGLGKTVTACTVMVRYPVRTLIIAPLALLDQWNSEIAKHTEGLSTTVYWGSGRAKIDGSGADVVITNPETVVGDVKRGVSASVFGGFQRLVIDEAHMLRNSRSKIYDAVRRLFCGGDKIRKIMLTGTPVCNKSDDLVSLVTLLNMGEFSSPEFWRGIHIKREIEALQEIRKDAILRRTKEEVLSGMLPKKEILDIPIELEVSEVYKKEYKRLQMKHIQPVIAKILRLRQCVNQISLIHKTMSVDPAIVGEYGADLPCETSAKLKYIREAVAAVPADEKIVIFSQWTTMLEHVRNVCTEIGVSAQTYTGKMGAGEKAAALDKFRTDPGERVLLVSLRAGGCGLNLCVANHVIMTEPYFNVAEEKQAIDRVYRIGQTKNVTVHRLFVPNTVESWMLQLQKMKDTVSNSVLTGCEAADIQIIAERDAKVDMFHKLVQ